MRTVPAVKVVTATQAVEASLDVRGAESDSIFIGPSSDRPGGGHLLLPSWPRDARCATESRCTRMTPRAYGCVPGAVYCAAPVHRTPIWVWRSVYLRRADDLAMYCLPAVTALVFLR